MSQPGFNVPASDVSTPSQAPAVQAIDELSRMARSRPHDEVIMHVASPRMSKRPYLEDTCQVTNHHVRVYQEGQNDVNDLVRECLPTTNDGEQDEVIRYLREWAADSQVTDGIRLKRSQVRDEMIKWSMSFGDVLSVTWNLLPNVFHMPFMQSRLRHLLIHCPANELPEAGSNVLELPELAGHLTKLKGLYIYGDGITDLSDSIGSLSSLKRLDMVSTNITQLPESIGELSRLRSLKLLHNIELTKLPKSIVQLKQLRLLSLDRCEKLNGLPDSHHRRSQQDLSDDESHRFSNLESLSTLSLKGCYALERLPSSLCKLKNLVDLNLEDCRELSELPEQIGSLIQLHTLNFTDTKIEFLPISLYRLALSKSQEFLPFPWNEPVLWMAQAISGQRTSYVMNTQRDELQINVNPQTMVPFAQEHLRLLVQALERHGLTKPPKNVFVRYEGERGIDQGGLKRHFFNTIFPNLALQTKDDHPIFKFSEEKGYYVLEKELGSLSTAQDIEMCENIGKLLCALLCGLSEECKIGNVFSQHFYGYLFLIGFVQNIMFVPSRSHQITKVRQRFFCCSLATLDKDGIKDREGNLLFQESYFKTFQMTNHDLYKLWMLLACAADKEELEGIFPKMLANGFIFDDPAGEHVIDKDALANSFRRDIISTADYPFMEFFIRTTLVKYAEDMYMRQCEALTSVIRGFQSASEKEGLQRIFAECDRGRISDSAAALSLLAQGPPFTRTAFESLMHRCFFCPSVSVDMYEDLNKRMVVIVNWYLSLEPSSESEEHMKRLVRCMIGSDVIMPDRNLLFRGPRIRDDHMLEPRSIFHTCTGLVELGNAVLTQETATPAEREKLIEIWLEHITEALGAGFSLA